MRSFRYFTADIFTDRQFGGNQLAVFPDARGISPEDMQRIAREFNFSETTFVLPPQDKAHTRHVRIFTPGYELPFAGHPTVGTAFVLASIGDVPLTGDETRIVLEEKVGPVPVTIRARDGKPGFSQLSVAKLPEFGPPPPPKADLARVFGLSPSDIQDDDERRPENVSCGVGFLIVPLRSRAALAKIELHIDDFKRLFAGYWTDKVFLFCSEPERQGSDYRARMFAPEIGVPEDPATGSACASFGGYIGKRKRAQVGTLSAIVEQGFEMGRPSIMHVEVDKQGGAITAVRVGGDSVMVSEGQFFLH